VNVTVNGEPVSLETGTTIAGVVASTGREPTGRGIAVAVNGEVVPRGEWSSRTVDEADKVEVLAAIGGG
jgi:sulfur carrier protein